MSASEEQHKLHFPLCGTGTCTVATQPRTSRKKSLTAAAMFGLAGLAASSGLWEHDASSKTGEHIAPGVSLEAQHLEAQHEQPNPDAWKINYAQGGTLWESNLQALPRGSDYSWDTMPTPAPFGSGSNTTTTMQYEMDQFQKDVTQITNETTDIVQASSDLQQNATLLGEQQPAETNEVVESALELERNSTELCQKMVELNINATELQIKNKYDVTDEQIKQVDVANQVTLDDIDTNVSEQVEQGLAEVEKRDIAEPNTKIYDEMEQESLHKVALATWGETAKMKPHAPSANFKTLMSHLSVQKAALKNMCSASSASCTSDDTSLEKLQQNVKKGITTVTEKTDIRPPEEASNTDKAIQNIKEASVLLYSMLTCSGLC